MKYIIVISYIFISYFVVSEEPRLDLCVAAQQLSLLRSEEYVQERNKLLEYKELAQLLTKAPQPTQLLERIIYSALAYRLQNAEEATIVDKYFKPGLRCHNDFTSDENLISERASRIHYRIIIACVGTEAFPVIAEDIIFETGVNLQATMRALIELRNPDVIEILTNIASDSRRSPVIRAMAVYNLGLMMRNISETELNIKHDPKKLALGNRRILDTFSKKLAPRHLPKFELSSEKKVALCKVILNYLDKSNPEQMRTVSAFVLRQSKESVLPLIRVLKEDTSPWVRAWCATSLLAIGGDEALKAIEVAKNTEKNAEVLLVLEGKAKPFAPWDGIPKNSILQKSNDMPSNAP